MPPNEDEFEGDCSELLDPRLALALRIWTLDCVARGAAMHHELQLKLKKPKTGESPK